MAIAARDYGTGRLSQVVEMLRLAVAPGHLTPKEYYDYHLFDGSQFNFSEKRQFLGHAGQEKIKKFLINNRWKVLADDKFIFTTLYQSQGLPLAKILATYNYKPNQRARSIPSISTADDLISFLANGRQYPFFGKPVAGIYGLGCMRINGFDPTARRITLASGDAIPIDRFIGTLGQFPDGYMFQEIVHPHRVLRNVCGDRLATVRVVVLLDRRGPRIFRACWKIPTGENISDNFQHGKSGNLLAAVDIDDGRVGTALQGMGVNQKSFACHPDTGERIQGLSLPYWREVKDLCAEAAALLPGFRLQSWDIAIRDEGPILLEVQGGDFDVLQVSGQNGMLDDELRQFLRSINKNWQRDVILSTLEEVPRRIYRLFYPRA